MKKTGLIFKKIVKLFNIINLTTKVKLKKKYLI